MPGPAELQTSFSERKLLRWLLLFYFLFILYGSFIPFRFSDDPEFVHSQLTRFLTLPYDHGVRKFSLPDVVSNILFFVPFGFLWVGVEFFSFTHGGLPKAVLVAGILGLLTGLMIESGQMFSPGRTASILDALCNGLGAAIGAATGRMLFRAFRGSFGLILLQLLQQRPSLVLLALLLFAAGADAYYPLTLLWMSLPSGRISKTHNWFRSGAGCAVFGWIYSWRKSRYLRQLVISLSSVLNKSSSLQANEEPGCSLIAALIEGGKLFFAGRAPNIDNVILGSLGAFAGCFFVPSLAATAFVRQHARGILAALILCLVAYSELSPFDWIHSIDEIPLRMAKIEWLPMGSYYHAEPQAALFDLAKKLFCWGRLVFLSPDLRALETQEDGELCLFLSAW
jgi:VanZ family protein